MNEQTTAKRRGRPPRVRLSNLSDASKAGTPIDMDKPIQFYRDPFDVELSQAYALRVWNGQSVDVPRHERLERVRKALEGQGLSMEGVVL